MTPIDRTTWAIPEGYIPKESAGPVPEMLSHETACILNAGSRDFRQAANALPSTIALGVDPWPLEGREEALTRSEADVKTSTIRE